MKNTIVRIGFALAVASTALGGVVAASTSSADGAPQATKQYCC